MRWGRELAEGTGHQDLPSRVAMKCHSLPALDAALPAREEGLIMHGHPLANCTTQ